MKYEIGSISVEQGARANGEIEIARMHNKYVTLPLIVLHGAEEGPTLLLTAGVHGTEHAGCMAIHHLARTIDPSKMRGTLIAVPVANMPAFMNKSAVNPWDATDLEICFMNPKREGTVSERLAHVMVNELLPRADFHIDIHQGPPPSYMLGNLPWEGCLEPWRIDHKAYKVTKSIINKGKEMLLAWGTDSIMWRCPWPQMLHCIAAAKGIPGIASECETVAENCRGIANVMKWAGMIGGVMEPMAEKAMFFDAARDLFNYDHTGFWLREVKMHEKVYKGASLGPIIDPATGRKLGDIISPIDGIMLLGGGPRAVYPGSWLGCVGNLIETIPLKKRPSLKGRK